MNYRHSVLLATLFLVLPGCSQESSEPPSLSVTSFTAPAGETSQFQWTLRNDSEEAVSFLQVEPPEHGEVELLETGFRYSPDPGYLGPDQWALVLKRGNIETSPITLSLTLKRPTWLAGLGECDSGVFSAFTTPAIEPPPAASEGYIVADSGTQAAVSASLQAWFARDMAGAIDHATTAGYDLCLGASPEVNWVLWSPKTLGDGKASWALNWDSRARGLIFETPHPVHDLDTLPQGVTLAQGLNARALLTSGTHRCANTTASGCSGETSVCSGGAPAPYPESDMAHTVASRFQAAHTTIAANFNTDLVVSLHGFGDNGISLSNGTTDDIPDNAPVATLVTMLKQLEPELNVTTCNAFPGTSAEQRLCGTTNVQGRHLNGSQNACTLGADQASERFIHMEQSLTVRRDKTEAVMQAFQQLVNE